MNAKSTGMSAVKGKVKTLSELARCLGLTRGAVAQWTEVPPKRVLKVSEITGLSPHEIRPDIFPPNEPAK